MKKSNKSFILIIDKTESNWYHYKIQEKIHELCEQTGVPENKIVYISNDMKSDEVYDNWFETQSKYKTKINFIPYPGNMFHRSEEVKKVEIENGKVYHKIEKYKNREKLPTKKFICLMGHKNTLRDKLWNFFEKNKFIKDTGYISYLGENVCLPNSSTHSDEELCKHFRSAPQDDRLQSYHTDSYYSIVPEGEAGYAFSEKIHKPLLHGHPFMLLSYNTDINEVGIGMLEKLKEWGFETFPELFDETYDVIGDLKKRNNIILNNILRINRMGVSELHKVCESVEEKCIHNQKTILSLEIPNKQLVNKLESIKTGRIVSNYYKDLKEIKRAEQRKRRITEIMKVGYTEHFSNKVFKYIKDNAIIYKEIYRHSKPLMSSLNKEELVSAYAKMAVQNKKFILIIEVGESNWFNYKNQIKIHELCEQTGISEDKIVYITNDVMCDVVYDKWFTNQTKYKTKINFINYPCLLVGNKKDSREIGWGEPSPGYYNIEKYQDREILPTKKFMCLIGHRTEQRDFLWDFLKDKSGHTSYLGRKIALPNSVNLKSSEESLIEFGNSDPSTDRLQKYYRDSYFSIVPEGEGGGQLSEKTHKPLLYGHPFILFSYNQDIGEFATGVLSRLKEWGFETFPELFDESYDEISDVDERRNNFKQQILRLYNMETKELQKLCESVEEKCIHNQKTILSLEIPDEQLISKLENLL